MNPLVHGYLRDLGRRLNLSAPQERDILNEIRDHVEDSAQAMLDEGISQDDAIFPAVSGLGASNGVARLLCQVHAGSSWFLPSSTRGPIGQKTTPS